jgi:hypothetical protein
MEKWHVATLVLEMLGFGLAYIHVFRESLAHQAATRVQSIRDLWFFPGLILAGGVDYQDPPIPYEERDALANGRAINMLLQLVLFIVLFRSLNFGVGFGWGIAEFFVAMLLTVPAAILVHLALIFLIRLIVGLAVAAGKGNIVAGVGFFLAALGMSIETWQVLSSRLWWTAATLWGSIAIVSLTLLLRRGRRSQ